MKLFYLLIFFVCIVFYSCTASTTDNNSSNSDISFEELRARVNENAKKLKSLDADGDISIDSPTMSNTGSITVSLSRPDSIFTKLEGPFGIDVANLLITRNNFVYYNVMENRVIRGPSSPKNLGIIMRIKVDFDDIINAFSGKYTIDNETYDETKITVENNNYVVNLKKQNETKKYWINRDDFYVTKFGEYDSDGKIKIEITYDSFYESNDIFFPKRISISRPKENQNIWLNYSKEEFNKNRLTYKLKVPKSAKEVTWN